MIEVGHRHQA